MGPCTIKRNQEAVLTDSFPLTIRSTGANATSSEECAILCATSTKCNYWTYKDGACRGTSDTSPDIVQSTNVDCGPPCIGDSYSGIFTSTTPVTATMNKQ